MRHVFAEDVHKKLCFAEDADFSFSARMVHFSENIEIRSCRTKEFDVFGMYCEGGLTIYNCEFDCKIDWESGGHNKAPIVIENCVFKRFVNFEDCYFENELILKNVVFAEGTNLMGNKGTPVRVGFDIIPCLENVSGNLEINTFDKTPRYEKQQISKASERQYSSMVYTEQSVQLVNRIPSPEVCSVALHLLQSSET